MPRCHHLTVRGQLLSLNQERKLSKFRRSEITKQWRTDAKFEALAAELPHLDRVTIIAAPLQAKHRLGDAGNCLPSVKGIVDGLCDAGVLDDDGPEFVRSITMLAPERAVGTGDAIRLELVEVAS